MSSANIKGLGWYSSIRNVFAHRWAAWTNKRLPKSKTTVLNQRQIFIVPNRLTAALLVLVLVLFILAANFQNSLIYGVCFWLLALPVLNILHTWRNLAGLQIRAISAAPGFAGETITLELELSRPEKRCKYALNIGWPQQDTIRTDLIDNQTLRIKLSHPAQQRGLLKMPRLTIRSTWPTGLATAWSYFTPDLQAVVYPAPKAHPVQTSHNHTAAESDSGAEIPRGSSDFGGIREYQPGDTPRHIHWGKYAQTDELYTKEFVDYQTDDQWLDWDALTIPGTEARLSHLCSKVLELHRQQQHFGLRLPGNTIPPGHSETHKNRCLHALALHGINQ